MQAYLGSESDEDDQPGEERQSASDRYRQLLTGAANNARQPSPDSAKEVRPFAGHGWMASNAYSVLCQTVWS